MSDFPDLDDVLHRFVTHHQADRLLSGHLNVDNVGEDLHDVARVFAAIRTPDNAHQATGGAFEAFTSSLRDGTAPTEGSSRKSLLTKRLTGKALAVLAAATILSGGAAAAATGSLPDPVQSAVAKTLSHVSVDVPNPNHKANNDKPDETPVGPDAGGPAKAGLCTASSASASSKGNS